MATPFYIHPYLEQIAGDVASGISTEHTHRPGLKGLLESVAPVKATNEPTRVCCGAPDFSVWEDTPHGPLTIGYVEAKDVNESLSGVEDGEQLLRYRAALPNLVLTNYLEFRWYVDGVLVKGATLARIDSDGRVHGIKGGADAVLELLGDFLAREPQAVSTALELAEKMARLTRLIRDIVVESFANDLASEQIRDLHRAFEEILIPNLTANDFADMFAQTMAYGLFAARANHAGEENFTRRAAGYEIPRTNPFLRKLFAVITGPELDEEPYAGIVDDLAQLLAIVDLGAIFESFGAKTISSDPIVHFYETFLAAYDPEMREMRGVYYTPRPIVSYIVSSVDLLLRDSFGCGDGLAQTSAPHFEEDPKDGSARQVVVLDPACGTGTFLYSIIDLIRAEFAERNDAGMWPAYVREELIPRLFGFELLVAPYAVAHLKLGMQLAAQDLPEPDRSKWEYSSEDGSRLGIYLTNTLEEAVKKSEVLLGSFISEEANAAADIKRSLPILVVLGNPPYSGHSANNGPWITKLIADYAEERPGIPRPAQGKWLQDDYVKFIRFGEWRIERTGAGVLAFITNHSYLDSPTFAGMRSHLMETFTDIYILDLHGNAKKGERAPDGGRDQNVFDIQQGVAISIFVKEPEKTGPARLHHADLFGLRQWKYDWLEQHDIRDTNWVSVTPDEPFHLFVPQDLDLRDEFERGWSVAQIMGENGKPAPGLVTTHDQFAISWTKAEARSKVVELIESRDEEQARSRWKLCSTDQWEYEKAKKELSSRTWESEVGAVLYRPFDVRWTTFDSNVAVHRRERVTGQLQAGPNLALITTKATKGESFAHVQAARLPAEAICMSSKTSNNAFIFPLYLYPQGSGKQRRLLIEGEHTGRQVNLSPSFIEELKSRLGAEFVADGTGDLGETFGPEDVFAYIYAVLHTPGYRQRYLEQLRRDFPHIPLPFDMIFFAEMARRGHELVGLHLLDRAPSAPEPSFPVPGSDIVAAGHPRYVPPGSFSPNGESVELKRGRVYISGDADGPAQYFDGITPEVWEFRIGGYQVCGKWLKDRRKRRLDLGEIRMYQRMIATLGSTIAIMAQLDEIAPTWPLDSAAEMGDQADLSRSGLRTR
jgi:hypothetical protein